MTRKELFRRYLFYIVGLYILAIGIALIIKSNLGSSPTSSWAYVMGKNTSWTVGVYTVIINIAMIGGQIAILYKHGLKKEWLNIGLQLPFSIVFGAFIDSGIWLYEVCVEPFITISYLGSYVILVLGMILQAIGILLEVRPNVTMMSAEALVNYACRRWKWEFGTIKVWWDVVIVLLALICSIGFHISYAYEAGSPITLQTIWTATIECAREGTIISALLIGHMVTWLKNRWAPAIDNYFVR